MNSLPVKLGVLAATAYLCPTIATSTSHLVASSLTEHSLAFLNPGNASGVIVGYIAACTTISLTARLLRLAGSISVSDVLWWGKAITLLSAGSIASKLIGQALVDKQFGLLVALAFAGLGIVQISRLKFPEYDFNQFVGGVRVGRAKDIAKAHGPLSWGTLPWGADQIKDRAEERLHFLIFGNIGGGKTTYMKMMMAAVAPREGELWVVFDPKIELIPYLVALGKRPLILNPLDTRAIAWDLHKDIVNTSHAEGFAELIIEDGTESSKGEDDHWTLSARNILVALIEVFIASGLPWQFRDICLAVLNPDDLIALLKRNPNASVIVQGLTGTHRSGANDYLLTVNTKLRPLHVIASRWHRARERISITELVNNPSDFNNMALVLGTDHTAGKIIGSLNEFIFERFQQLTMNTDERVNSKETVYRVWCDELSTVSRRNGRSLVKFMTKVRSKGGSAVLLTQNEAGFYEKFGEKIARQIFDTAIHKAVIGGVDGHTAKNLSDEVGEQDLVEADIGYATSNTTVDDQIDKGRSQKTLAQNMHQSFRRVRRLAVPKEKLLDSAMDSAGPNKGLHGFFMGSGGGPHFIHIPWATAMAMQVEQDTETQSYSRLDERSSDYQLTAWSEREREKWGLAIAGQSTTDENNENTSPLPDWDNGETVTRSTVLEVSGLSDSELESIATSRGLPAKLQRFSIAQINQLEIYIDTVTLTVEA